MLQVQVSSYDVHENSQLLNFIYLVICSFDIRFDLTKHVRFPYGVYNKFNSALAAPELEWYCLVEAQNIEV